MSTIFPNPRVQAVLQRKGQVLKPVVDVAFRRGQASFNATSRTDDGRPTIMGGSVMIDRTRIEWTTATLAIGVTPEMPNLEVVNPFGAELDIDVGIELVDGTLSTVRMGTGMVVTSVGGEYHQGGVLQISVTDRSRRVTRWRFERPFNAGKGDLANVVGRVLNNRGFYPDGRKIQLGATGTTLVADHIFGLEASLSPWEECVRLCESFGFRLYVDRQGDPIIDQQPDPRAGVPREVILMSPGTPSMSDEPPNVIVARFEPNDGPARVGIAEDDDPSSPTFVGGPYGRVTGYHGPVNLRASKAGARNAAQKILEQRRWQGPSWSWVTPFDPTIDPDDLLRAEPRSESVQVAVDSVSTDFAGGTTVAGRQPI